MRLRSQRRFTQLQRGVAAVELALILPFLLILISAPLFFGRVFWHYTVIQKAAHDSAMYLSRISAGEMRTPVHASAAAAVARDIALAEMADLNTGLYAPSITVLCGTYICDGLAIPKTVRVAIRAEIQDPIFGSIYAGEGVLISSDVTLAYNAAN